MEKGKRHIVYIGNFDFNTSNAAIERAMNNLRIIKRNGNECSICGFGNEAVPKEIDGIKIDVVEKPTSTKSWINYFTNVKRYSKYAEKDIDTIFILYNLPSALMFNIYTKYRKKVKLVADVTEWYSVGGLSFVKKLIKGVDISLRMNYLHKKMDGLIVISDLLKKHYEKHEKLVLIPPLVNNIYSNYEYIPSKKVEFVYSGYPGYDKDRLDLIVEATGILRLEIKDLDQQIRIRVLGISKEEFKSLFPDQTLTLDKLGDIFDFRGSQPHKVSINALIESDYSFLIRDSSLKNNAGFPTKFSECKTIGIPVVYSNFSDIKKFTNDNDVYIETVSAKEISNSLRICLEKGKQQDKKNSTVLTISNSDYNRKFSEFFESLY